MVWAYGKQGTVYSGPQTGLHMFQKVATPQEAPGDMNNDRAARAWPSAATKIGLTCMYYIPQIRMAVPLGPQCKVH